MRRITLNNHEMTELMRPAAGQGGWQGLITYLQGKLNQATGEISLSDEDRGRICRYAFDYGDGGWEGQLQRIFGRHLGEMRRRD